MQGPDRSASLPRRLPVCRPVTRLASLSTALQTCRELEFPVATEKTEGPSTSLVFLGILIDTTAGTLELPQRKLDQLRALVQAWEGKRAPIKRQLLSLIGHLSHAASVIRPGRTFLRRLIDTASQARALHHYVRLNTQCKADLHWWLAFGLRWSGCAIWPPELPSVSCVSDASGSWGCGAFLPDQSSPAWFQLQWPAAWAPEHIAAKEMVPVVVAAALWGRSWADKRVIFRSDNSQVVAAISSGTSRHKTVAHLTGCLFFLAASFQFVPAASHIPGHCNTAADALSRGQLAKFRHRQHCYRLKSLSLYRTGYWTQAGVGPHPAGGNNSYSLWTGYSPIHQLSILIREEEIP